jgi:hypothetical protein
MTPYGDWSEYYLAAQKHLKNLQAAAALHLYPEAFAQLDLARYQLNQLNDALQQVCYKAQGHPELPLDPPTGGEPR